ncbi:hypothetical protein EVAR_96886_1 [Eumeta japonica]|uniref:Uncharacterized protein n=1 Tax=Eumeta variegata TaxID=151549 RepID=A0A4C1WFK3_EUMVA|nr:hypothetical protein EVAR_96886_1 [Eumeta japonica]
MNKILQLVIKQPVYARTRDNEREPRLRHLLQGSHQAVDIYVTVIENITPVVAAGGAVSSQTTREHGVRAQNANGPEPGSLNRLPMPAPPGYCDGEADTKKRTCELFTGGRGGTFRKLNRE